MDKIWESLAPLGYSKYEVSNTGEIRNARTHRVLAVIINQNNTHYVSLYSDRHVRSNLGVAKLVASIFIPNLEPEIFTHVCHRDGRASNNEVSNLEWRPHWFTIQYQMEYQDIDLTLPKHPVREVTSDLIFKNGRAAANYYCLLEADIHRCCMTGRKPVLANGISFEYINESET